jgi:hypothetical protein
MIEQRFGADPCDRLDLADRDGLHFLLTVES